MVGENSKHKFFCPHCNKGYVYQSGLDKHVCKESNEPNPPDIKKPVVKKVRKKASELCTCIHCNARVDFKKIQTHHCTKNAKQIGTKEFIMGIELWKMGCVRYGMRTYSSEEQTSAFIRSKQFKLFFNLASFIVSKNVVDYKAFVRFLFNENIPTHKWIKEDTYDTWVSLYLISEQPIEGITRTIDSLIQWQQSSGVQWNKIFDLMTPDRFTTMLKNGYISPWLIYSFPASSRLLTRMSTSEIDYIFKFMNPSIWNSRKILYNEEIKKIQQTFAGVW